MNDVNAPLDWLHDECAVERARIRAAFRQLRDRAALWEPAPIPPRPVETGE